MNNNKQMSFRRVQLEVELDESMNLSMLRELLTMQSVRLCDARPVDRASQSVPQRVVNLGPTQMAVLRLFSCCDREDEIAAHLGVSPCTVHTHVQHIFGELRVHSRAHALGRAFRLGLLTESDLRHPPTAQNHRKR